MASVLTKEEEAQRQPHTEEDCQVKREAETGVMGLQARNAKNHQTLGSDKEGCFSTAFEGKVTLLTL